LDGKIGTYQTIAKATSKQASRPTKFVHKKTSQVNARFSLFLMGGRPGFPLNYLFDLGAG